jgi:uncharacterized protein (TIGR02466 family)
MIISPLFPTAAAEFNFDRVFNDQELECVNSQERVVNRLNSISVNKNILDLAVFDGIREFMQASVDQYFEAVYSPLNAVKLKITQSWLNYTNTNESHHAHSHQNSFVSGVFYIQTEDTDKIHFLQNQYKQLEVPAREFNLYNSNSWWLAASTGKLVLFPSSLVHHVEPVVANRTRISLSFNTFPVGQLGSVESSTSLFL